MYSNKFQNFPEPVSTNWDEKSIAALAKNSNKYIVLDMLEKTQGIPGNVVECGVWQGNSLAAMAAKLKTIGSQKIIWAFDSFQGLPSLSSEDRWEYGFHSKAKEGVFADTSVTLVEEKLRAVGYSGGVRIVPGWFEKTLDTVPGPFSFVFLDCDLYESYRTCLIKLWPKLSKGGVIVLDEYFSEKFPGAKKAIDEFFMHQSDKPSLAREYMEPGSTYERWYVRKTV